LEVVVLSLIARYAFWLHLRWPAGTVEKLPEVSENGACSVAGVRIVGDLTGIPLLKFSLDTGARAVQAMLGEKDFRPTGHAGDGVVDLAIVGAGVSGVSAAVEAKRARPSITFPRESRSSRTRPRSCRKVFFE
jgi:hypothetical protein